MYVTQRPAFGWSMTSEVRDAVEQHREVAGEGERLGEAEVGGPRGHREDEQAQGEEHEARVEEGAGPGHEAILLPRGRGLFGGDAVRELAPLEHRAHASTPVRVGIVFFEREGGFHRAGSLRDLPGFREYHHLG